MEEEKELQEGDKKRSEMRKRRKIYRKETRRGVR